MLTAQQLKERLNQLKLSPPKNLSKGELQIHLTSVLRELTVTHLNINIFNRVQDLARRERRQAADLTKTHVSNETNSQQHQTLKGDGYTEAKTIAELLGCHLIITTINNQTKETSTHHINQMQQNDAPIIHLKCRLDSWSYNDKTLGDNSDYLYDAMALALSDFSQNTQEKFSPQINTPSHFEAKIITNHNERLELYNRL
jgi:hypothetical protein